MTIKITEKTKIDDIIENFDVNATYQIQNQSNISIKIYQGNNTQFLVLDILQCFLYAKGSIDYYIEPYGKDAFINYWKLED